MPKLTIDRVAPMIARIRAGDFTSLGAGPIRQRAERLYQKAIDGKLTGQERRDAYDFYQLSLQMERSTDPRAIMALSGLELGIPGDGWIYGRKFEIDPIPRNDFERRVDDKDPNSELIARGQDWAIDIPLDPNKDKDLQALRKVIRIAEDFPGVTLAIPETLTDKSVVSIYANHLTIKSFEDKLIYGGLAFNTSKSCFDKDGNILWQIHVDGARGGIKFNKSIPTTEGLVNNDHGKMVAPDFAIRTDVGTLQIREKNEDSAGYAKLTEDLEVWVVADGMGGHTGGALASKLTVETIIGSMGNGKNVIEAVKDAVSEVNKNAQGGGSTVVVFVKDRKTGIGQMAWVGDSRGRFATDDAEGLLTVDHSRLFNQVRFKLRETGRDIELPITGQRMEEIESLLDVLEATGRQVDPTYNIRSIGNIIDSAIGHGVRPIIGLVEFKLGDGKKPAKVALYSDGQVDGPEKEIESELAVTEILRKPQSAGETAEELLAYAFSAGTTDNVTVAVVDVKEGLNLAELKEISGEKFQQELIARLSDVNYRMNIEELRHLVEVYLLNPSIVPPELIERTKQKVLTSTNPVVVELFRKIDPSIPPVQPVIVPPPLPANPPPVPVTDESPTNPAARPTREVTDSMLVKPGVQEVFVDFMHKGKVNTARFVFDGNWGQLNKDEEAKAIAAAFRQTKGKDKSTIYLSHTFMEYLRVLKNTGTDEERAQFYLAIRNAVLQKGWVLSRDRVFIYFDSSKLTILALEEKELTAEDRKVHFPSFTPAA